MPKLNSPIFRTPMAFFAQTNGQRDIWTDRQTDAIKRILSLCFAKLYAVDD